MLNLRAAIRGLALLVQTTLASMRMKQAQLQFTQSDPRGHIDRSARIRVWAGDLLDTFGIEGDITGELPPGPYLLVANHRSAIDIGIILAHADVSLVARADLANWPVFGRAAQSVGTVFVERGGAASGAATLRMLVEALRAGKSMALFPEGHTYEGDEVRQFQPGLALVAFMAKVPIVPVGIAYESGSRTAFVDMNFAEHVVQVASSPRARVTMSVGAAMPPPTRDERAEYTERVRSEVQRLVQHARSRVDRESR